MITARGVVREYKGKKEYLLFVGTVNDLMRMDMPIGSTIYINDGIADEW